MMHVNKSEAFGFQSCQTKWKTELNWNIISALVVVLEAVLVIFVSNKWIVPGSDNNYLSWG